VVPVGVDEDGVASSPEGVVGRLCSLVPGSRHRRVPFIDLVATCDTEADDDPRLWRYAPRRVVEAGKVLVVDVDRRLAELEMRVPDLANRTVVDLDTESPVERNGRVIVARDEIYEIELRALCNGRQFVARSRFCTEGCRAFSERPPVGALQFGPPVVSGVSPLEISQGADLGAVVELLDDGSPPPLIDPNDMMMVASPCHSREPLKVSEEWVGTLHCLVCGREFVLEQ
jgi:hypothetical protein